MMLQSEPDGTVDLTVAMNSSGVVLVKLKRNQGGN
jgi:hypothetical protein